MRHWLLAIAACSHPAPAPAPPPVQNAARPPSDVVASTPMRGPFRTFTEACNTIPPCVSEHFSDEEPAPAHPTSECANIPADQLDDWQDTRLHHHDGDFEIHLVEVACTVPRFVPRDVSAGKTFAFVRRGNGWWIGPALFEHDDERDCGQAIEPAAWERHGRLFTLSVQRSHTCWACGKGGNDTAANDLVLAFDPGAAIAYQPVVVGAHSFREVDDPEGCAATPRYDAVLQQSWAGYVLTLAGTAQAAPDGVERPVEGTYRFSH